MAPACAYELDVNSLLLRTDTLTTKHREIKEELSWKVPSYWLAFILLRSTMQVDNKERSSIGLL